MSHLESRSSYTVSCLLTGLAIPLLTLLFASASSAEVSSGFRIPGVPGLIKTDLSPTLHQNTISNPIPDPGITLVSSGENYQWTGLPDVAAGSGTVYILLWDYDGLRYSYEWPDTTRTPQSTVNRLSTQVTQNPIELVSGSTLPSASLRIKGLAADPTGSSAIFTLYTSSGTEAMSDAPATISDIDQLVDGTWEASVTHEWTTVETSVLSGTYYGRFTITLSGGGVLISPAPPGRLQVKVYP